MSFLRNFFIAIFILSGYFSFACTTAVISGKATSDGRPILWKLRDTDFLENYVKQFDRAKGNYAFIGLINSADTVGKEVWGGNNEVGFAIMNSASFNVNLGDSSKIRDQEGFFMKLALEKCATLKDFENLLENTPKPMGLAAHFGVIDAQGGAAFYEVNNYSWTKFDANNAETAPDGYILRTNFSKTGKPNIGYGFVRLMTAEKLFENAKKQNKINYKTILQEFSRCLYNPITGNDYKEIYKRKAESDTFIHSDNLITSYGSASCIVIQGIKKDENAKMTTMWTQVGYPNTCIAVPLWCSDTNLPNIIIYDKELENSKLNSLNMKLFKECYPIENPDGYHYLNISKLVNSENVGYMQVIEPIENKIFALADEKLLKWRKMQPSNYEIKSFYAYLDNLLETTYNQLISK